MSSNIVKVIALASTLGLSTGAIAAGEAGDVRIQFNGTSTDAYTFLTGSIQKYQSDVLVLGGTVSLSDFATVFGGEAKMIMPSADAVVPYFAGSAAMFIPDNANVDSELVLAISGGVDVYIAENAGYNFDVEIGLSDLNDETTFSFGMFYEF